MTFEVEIHGRTRTVSIERTAAGHYRVTLDGQPHDVDAVRVGDYGLSLVLDAKGVSRKVQVTPRSDRGRAAAGAERLVTLNGLTIPATLDGRRTSRGAADGGSGAQGEQQVIAPMPGRVVRLLVADGDEVDLQQGVIVVEAMKMENELRSPKKGRVKSIGVSAGTSVEAGRVLLVVE